jgi:hypothetical protein
MMASGDGGDGEQGRRMVRRPAIRRRPISVPRDTPGVRTLPPVRPPAVRQAARPRLMLVVEDDAQELAVPVVGPSAPRLQESLGPRWQGSRSLIAGIACVLALLVGSTVVWLSSRPAGDAHATAHADPESMPGSITTVNAGSLSLLPKAPPTTVPLVDVNSLPAAPPRARAR